MLNKTALGYLAGVIGCIVIAVMTWSTVLSVRGPEAGAKAFGLALLTGMFLCGSIACSVSFATSLRNYPSRYIPAGRYRVLYANNNQKGVLVALKYIGEPAGKSAGPEDSEKLIKNTLSQTRLFFVPSGWFTPGDDALTHRDELVCERVEGLPIIRVSSDFHAKYCITEKAIAHTQAA